MNIDLKFSIDEIKYIEMRAGITRSVSVKTLKKDKLFAYSIMMDIAQKLEKKIKSFDDVLGVVGRKKYKVKLKFHEAIMLEIFILDLLKTEKDPYNLNLGLMITNQINQKFA